MTGVARIRFLGGGILLPARTAYERENALAALRHALHRNGTVRLECDGRRWLLSCDSSGECARCLRDAARYRVDDPHADGPTCFPCIGALLSLHRDGAATAAPFPEDEPLRGVASGDAASPAQPAPRRRDKETPSWPST